MEKSFVRFPADSVTLCAESVGIQPSQEVACGIVEDVSFRIRQLADTASQFMRHAKRRKLIGDDIDKAMKWSGLEPLYGHCSDQAPSFHSIHASGLYSIPDPEVKLPDIAFSTSFVNTLHLPKPLSIKASWMALEGSSLSNGVKAMSGPTHSVIELRRPPQETHQRYLSLLLEAVTGENEDLRRVALSDIQTNPSFANVLSDVAQHLSETLTGWPSYLPHQILRLLKLTTAVFKNTYLFLDPYVQMVFPLVKSILFNTSYQHSGGSCSHWHVREAAAMCLATMELRCGCSLRVELWEELHEACRQALASEDVALHVLYGVVVTLCHYGTKSLVSVLIPHLDAVHSRVHALLTSSSSSSSSSTQQESAFHVADALLLAAQVILTLDTEHIPEAKALMARTPDEGLYGYLVDLFGEKLVFLLCARTNYVPTKESVSGTLPVPLPVPLPGRVALNNDQLLLRYLGQEGFKRTRPPLAAVTQPKQRGPGRLFGGREPFRIAVRWSKVPLQGNILEDAGSRGNRRGLGMAERGASQSLRRRSRVREEPVLGVSSCWL